MVVLYIPVGVGPFVNCQLWDSASVESPSKPCSHNFHRWHG